MAKEDVIYKHILALLKVAKELNADVTPTKLQKIFFLLEKEGGVDLGLEFKPWFFGAYSKKLQDSINALINLGMVEVEEEEVVDVFTDLAIAIKRKYKLAEGVEVDDVDKKVMDFFRKWVVKSREEILTYVYRRYPQYSDPKIVRETIMKELIAEFQLSRKSFKS